MHDIPINSINAVDKILLFDILVYIKRHKGRFYSWNVKMKNCESDIIGLESNISVDEQ